MGKNITFHMNSGIESIQASPSDPSVASGVVLKDGTVLEADVVILGVGVKPATEFLKGSGIKLEKDGGILVDEYLKVPGFDGIYAIGDIAIYPQTENRTPKRIEHWNVSPLTRLFPLSHSSYLVQVAANHGRAVGRTITGKGEPFSKIPIFWSARK